MEVLEPVLEAALTISAGNRSSYLFSFYDLEGRWRVIPSESFHLDEWCERARRIARLAAVDCAWMLLSSDPFAGSADRATPDRG
jgi:hypothetical protein